MKKLIPICLCLFILTACAHKPVASPEEVNDYLNGLAYQEGIDQFEIAKKLVRVL